MTVARAETTVFRVGTAITLNRVLRTQLKLLGDRGGGSTQCVTRMSGLRLCASSASRTSRLG